MRVILAAPTVAMVMLLSFVRDPYPKTGTHFSEITHALSLVEILRLKLDRLAVRRAIRRMVPGVLVARKRCDVGHALLGDEPLHRVEPVPIVRVAGVGIARRLRALDLCGKRFGPLWPGEEAALVQRKRHREGLRLPRLAE